MIGAAPAAGKGDRKGDGSAPGSSKSSRGSMFSKQYKKINTNYAEEFGKKGIPMQKPESQAQQLPETRSDEIDWFFGYRGQGQARWNRLHAGMTPRQVKEERSKAFSSTAPAGLQALMELTEHETPAKEPSSTKGLPTARRSMMMANGEVELERSAARSSLNKARTSVMIDEAHEKNATTKARRSLKETIAREVSDSELERAEPLVPLSPASFPPINARHRSKEASSGYTKSEASSGYTKSEETTNLPAVRIGSCAVENSEKKEKKSHYQYFSKLCPLDFDEKRRRMEQKADMRNVGAKQPNLTQDSRILPDDSPRILMSGSSRSTNTPRKSDTKVAKPVDGAESGPSKAPPSRQKSMQRGKSMLKTIATAADDEEAEEKRKNKLTPTKKAVCEGLRIAVYGKMGNEMAKTQKEADEVYEKPRGDNREVVQLYHLWRDMDEDESGEISFREMLVFFRQKGLSIVGERAMKGIFGSNESKQVALEDLMRLMWPRAGEEDVQWMKDVIADFRSAGHTGVAPKELTKELMEELRDTFKTVDMDGSGKVTMVELRTAGLMTEHQVMDAVHRCGVSEEGELTLKEFMEAMCPAGYFVPKKLPASIVKEATS